MNVAERAAGLVVTEGLPVHLEMDGHHAPVPIFLSPQTLPQAPFTVAAVDAAQLIGAPHADPHVHPDHDEIYLCVTPGLRFEVETDAETIALASPASVFIPAGVRHRLIVHEVSTDTCPFLGILLDARAGERADAGDRAE
jgi:mannose-6-phosphate isomerase-like protein (cupin superfamily)